MFALWVDDLNILNRPNLNEVGSSLQRIQKFTLLAPMIFYHVISLESVLVDI